MYRSPDSGLGLTVLGVPITVGTILTAAASFLGLSTVDAGEQSYIDSAFARAMQGQDGFVALLAYWAGDDGAAPAVASAGLTSYAGLVNGAGARGYAARKFLEWQARHAAGEVGTSLIAQSDIPAQSGFFVRSLVPYLLVAGVVYVIARRR